MANESPAKTAPTPLVVRSIEVQVGAEAPFTALFLADAPTLAFIDYLKAQPLLKAVLCGHTHFFWKERFSPTATQIVCPGTYVGEALELRFA